MSYPRRTVVRSLNDRVSSTKGETVSIDQTTQVRREGSLKFMTKFARRWRVWIVVVPAAIFLLVTLEAHAFHTSKLLFCVCALLLIFMLCQQ